MGGLIVTAALITAIHIPSQLEPASVMQGYEVTCTLEATPIATYDESSAKEWIAMRESGGSYTAVSPTGKYYGRYQLTKSMLGGDLSPENQERVADAYVARRYGSWSAAREFWERNGWY